MNNPPTAVGGILASNFQGSSRLGMNDPPTAVGGILRAYKSMTKHIGIVAGSSEGAALCYRTICLEAPAIMGEHNHPEITMNSVPLAEHMRYIRADDWKSVGELMAASARKVAAAGADFAICPDNTYHQSFPYLIPPVSYTHLTLPTILRV